MVEVTPGIVKSTSSSAFSIDAIISRDSGPVSSSTAPHHCATARLHGLPPPPRPGGSPPDARLLPPHPHRHLSPGEGGVRDGGSISPTGRPSESPTGHPAAAMDVLTGGASRHAGGVFAAHSLASQLPPHHPHFPSPGLPPSHHSHLLTSAAAAAAAASESASLFSAGKPMYSHSLHGGGGHLEGASHTAGLFGQSLPAFPGGMSPAEASGLSTLHALSASKGLHGGALHGLAAGAMPLPGVHRQFPLYSWLSRPGAYFPRYTGSEPSFLLPFRKPKRIRTAFSPSQLLRLEHAFEKNHYVVGQERKDLAVNLSLTETQVKVWFQNRRTKHKRIKTEEEQEQHRKPDCKEEGDE